MLGYIVAGFGVGMAVGVTGVGGGSLMTPILIFLFGFSPAAAVGTDLLFAAGTKSFGTWLHGRQQTVDWPVVGCLAAGSLPASMLTTAWLNAVGIQPWVERLMLITLSLAIIATAVLTLLRYRCAPVAAGRRQSMPLRLLRRHRRVATVVCGVALGMLVTLSSVGAGVLGTTALLLLYPELKAVRIVGTDIAHAVPLTLIAGLGHLALGTTHVHALLWLLAGSLPGVFFGTRMVTALPDKRLRQLVSLLLVIVGGSMLWNSVLVALSA